MSRFGTSRSRRGDASKRTARAARWRAGRTGTGAPALLPDPASRLSDGVVVETRLTARLLGLRLLRVDGLVLVNPARLVDRVPAGVPPGARPEATGDGLATAARLLRENDERLRGLSPRGGSRRGY
jgi:hypothetical protein